jgi:hypothetical protein
MIWRRQPFEVACSPSLPPTWLPLIQMPCWIEFEVDITDALGIRSYCIIFS